MTAAWREFEPGLRVTRPTVRLTRTAQKCTHSYYTIPVESGDGRRILLYAFDRQQVSRQDIGTLDGRLQVAAADGSDPEVLAVLKGDPTQGVIGQWGGASRVAFKALYGELYWCVIDTATGEQWRGPENMREVSPDGKFLFCQPGEDVHLIAAAQGRQLSPAEVCCFVLEYETGRVDVRISVADVLAVHAEAETVRRQHLCMKQTLFSPTGGHLLFVLSNAWYLKHHPGVEPYRHELFVARRDGSGLRSCGPLITHPSWHPNGSAAMGVMPDTDGRPRFMLHPAEPGPASALECGDGDASGHPSIDPHTHRYLVTDVYGEPQPGLVTLRLFDRESGSHSDLAVAAFSDYSADSGTHMHPTWSRDGASIYFDSAHRGYAQVYRLDL